MAIQLSSVWGRENTAPPARCTPAHYLHRHLPNRVKEVRVLSQVYFLIVAFAKEYWRGLQIDMLDLEICHGRYRKFTGFSSAIS